MCTVITTVGYGDYTGSTTLEYQFTFTIEFLGFVVFSALQIAVLGIVKVDGSFRGQILQKDFMALQWFKTLEKSKLGSLPSDIYNDMSEILYRSCRRDFDLILTHGFYNQITPKM